ncbi:15-hydroxyprostaglandin dehydrogenase [NAD(+)] [Monomorium pharaonis]|uniref:15-hydroxyprostaglandin dehydrogenase [NAD(+)] n=1 Tax=Monomorium pharaonis TaxID=307658 RepID=UPI001745FA7F|nr:15-hydroxyprostaglandin dehydrogenase [NAD(+)] [Monomorium pharaonis]
MVNHFFYNFCHTMDNIQNKTAVVTGAGSGIGYHITEELLRKGAKKVAIIDLPIVRSYDATVTLQKNFGKDRVIFFPIDLTNWEVYRETFKKIVKALNGLDILVNNAGICYDRLVEQMFAINVVAVIRSSMLGINYMSKHKGGKGGTIVNISSISGIISYPLRPVYGSSKSAVVGFGLNLEKLYSKTGVRILTICPALTITAMSTTRNENKCLDVVEEDVVKEMLNKDFFVSQSAMHVGESVVVAIQKGENGSIWIVEKNEPPYPIKLPPFVAV